MTEEKADQIIRCVQECWWKALILISVGLGLAVALFLGWPTGDWELGWSALSAIGTLLAAFAAFTAAAIALKISRDEKKRESVIDREKAVIYKWIFSDELSSVKIALEQVEIEMNNYLSYSLNTSLPSHLRLYLNSLLTDMETPNLSQKIGELRLFGVEEGRSIAAIYANIPLTKSCIQTLTMQGALVTEDRKAIARAFLERIEMVWICYSRLNWKDELNSITNP